LNTTLERKKSRAITKKTLKKEERNPGYEVPRGDRELAGQKEDLRSGEELPSSGKIGNGQAFVPRRRASRREGLELVATYGVRKGTIDTYPSQR